MFAENPEKQAFVAVMQRVERDKLVQWISQPAKTGQETRGLLVLGMHMRRQQAAQTQCFTFGLRESRAPVQYRVTQHIQTAPRFSRDAAHRSTGLAHG
jgi:hypothetical protein